MNNILYMLTFVCNTYTIVLAGAGECWWGEGGEKEGRVISSINPPKTHNLKPSIIDRYEKDHPNAPLEKFGLYRFKFHVFAKMNHLAIERVIY